MKIDCPLILLAYIYLEKKRTKTHKEYSYGDLLETCERILNRSNKGNRFKKHTSIIQFKDGNLEVNDEIFSLQGLSV